MSNILKTKVTFKGGAKTKEPKASKLPEQAKGKRNKEFTTASLRPALAEIERYIDYWKQEYKIQVDHPVVPNIAPMGKGRRCYGYFTANTWSTSLEMNKGKASEVTITAEMLGRSAMEICHTVGHELAHAYNFVVYGEDKDTSRQGKYHNEVFKDTVESRGMTCLTPKEAKAKGAPVGYGITSLTPERIALIETVLKPDDNAFSLTRDIVEQKSKDKKDKKDKEPNGNKASKTRSRLKYTCGCQNIEGSINGLYARCTKPGCGQEFVLDIPEEQPNLG